MRSMEIEADRTTGHVGTFDLDLQYNAMGAQHQMLSAIRVNQNVLQPRHRSDINAGGLRRIGSRSRTKHGHPGFGQPDNPRLDGALAWISKRDTRSTPQCLAARSTESW